MADTASASTLRYSSDSNTTATESRSKGLQLPPPNCELQPAERGREVIRLAQEAFAQTGSWVVFYREMLGSSGIVRRLFSDLEELRLFEQSAEFAELQEMVAAMRSQDSSKADATEPERMITIRLPKSLHDALKTESEESNLSINKLCISKLLQPIEGRFIPIQQGRRRGRKPGPQGPRKRLGLPLESTPQPGATEDRLSREQS